MRQGRTMSKIKLGVAIAILLFAGVIVVSQLYDIPLLTKKQLPQSFEVIWEKDFYSEVLGQFAAIVALPEGGVIFARTKPNGKGISVPFIVRVDQDGNELWRTTFEDKYTINDLSVLKLMPNNSIMLVCDKKIENPDRVIPYILIFGKDGKLLEQVVVPVNKDKASIVDCDLIDDDTLYFVGCKYPYDESTKKVSTVSNGWFGKLKLKKGMQIEKSFERYNDSYFCDMVRFKFNYALTGISTDNQNKRQNIILMLDMYGKIIWDFKSENTEVLVGNRACSLQDNIIITVMTKTFGTSLLNLNSEAVCYSLDSKGNMLSKSYIPKYYLGINKRIYVIVNSVLGSHRQRNAFFVVGLQIDLNNKQAMSFLYKLTSKSEVLAEFFYDIESTFSFDDIVSDTFGDYYLLARSMDLSKNNPAQTRLIKLRIN